MDAMMAFRCDTQAHTHTQTAHANNYVLYICTNVLYAFTSVLVYSYKYIFTSLNYNI